MDSLQQQLLGLLKGKMCSKRDIMKLQGKSNWVGQVNPISRLMVSRTKVILSKYKHRHLDTKIKVSNYTKLSLIRWLHIPHIQQRLGNPTPQLIIQTDACLEGWGFRIGQESYNGSFDESMTEYSINILELITIWFALLKVQQHGLTLQILSDNSTAVAAIRRASSSQYHIHSLSELIWRRATEKRWNILVAHIKGSFNVLADQLSRNQTLSTEWSLHPDDFKTILKLNGNLQVDIFATSLNNQLKTFLSPCPDQAATGIDAMIIDWSRWDHLYLFPPTTMISQALAKLTVTNFKSAIMLTPNYPARPWYMALAQNFNPLKILNLTLQQKVGEEIVVAKQPTNIVVWELFAHSMVRSTQVVTKQ